jgi:hypothetical protein
VRLCLGFVIGALVGPLALAARLPWLGLAVTGAALLLPPLLALLIEPPYRSVGIGRILIGLLLLGAAILLVGALQALRALPLGFSVSSALLVVCGALTPALATLTVLVATAPPDGKQQTGAAIAVALAAWLGLGLRLFLPLAVGGGFSSTGPLGDLGALVGFVLVGLYCFSALIAIAEGLLAESLRAAATRR